MKNVLVTGGAGFIGSHLTDLLIESGHRVTVIDSLEPQVHSVFPSYLNPAAQYYFDRTGSRRLDYSAILKDIDTVFFFASKVGPNQSMTDIADYTDCNIGGLGHFLQNVLSFGKQVKRMVLSASMGPYGEGKYRCPRCDSEFYPRGMRKQFEFACANCQSPAEPLPLDESTQFNNISYYGLSKMVQEQMLALFAASYELEFVSLRYFSVYGPRQAFNNPYAGPIPIWIQNARHGKDLLVFEDGNQTRDFIYVGDITQINFLAGSLPMPSNVEIINCGTGASTTILDVAKQIKTLYDSTSEIVITNTIRPGDLRHSLADNSKLKRLLGYTAFTPINKGLRSFLCSTK